MQKIQINWNVLTPWAIAFVGWGGLTYQYFDSKPAAVVGFIEPGSTPITVTLDNGAKNQNADPDMGFFRFEEISRGLHVLRFESDGFHSFSLKLQIAGWGDNILPRPLQLMPLSGPKPLPENEILLTISITSSHDGSEPDFASILDASLLTFSQSAMWPSKEGWVYLGKRLDGNKYQGPFFDDMVDIETAFAKGSILQSTDPFFLRGDKPDSAGVFGFAFGSEYLLGDIIGIAQSGASVRIEEVVDAIGDDVFWARVSLVDEYEF